MSDNIKPGPHVNPYAGAFADRYREEAANKRHASLIESSRRLLADHEEMLSLLREASEALEPFVGMDEPGWTHTGADVARAQDVLAKIAKALTS